MISSNIYDFVIVGGGAAGISIAECLSRNPENSILLIEKNNKLAGETSGGFHEWLHTGALFTLVPDASYTTSYLLGAIDDLFIFYSDFIRNNFIATETGLAVIGDGWFNNHNINFYYRNRKFNFLWNILVNQSIGKINKISSHDWLRKRGGSINFKSWLLDYHQIKPDIVIRDGVSFFHQISTDITMNSRILLGDLLNNFVLNNGKISLDTELFNYKKITNDVYEIVTSGGIIYSRNIVLCAADKNSKFTNESIKTSYAPMFVVENLSPKKESFVELDYKTKNCINLINKLNGYGLAGGITVQNESDIHDYLNYCIKEHMSRNPEINVVDSYIGLKKELTSNGQNRNYLYHINKVHDGVYSIILGKFSLLFSLAPEFYRRIYNKNPPISVSSKTSFANFDVLDFCQWQKIVSSLNFKDKKWG
ncbi:FAD-dependent oxidoreductase [Polynucleobacter sp. MWH-Spelu-300-X4]|uniref:FAD-dependent oxidoreductase n=1 Tax=Polynucleobacter sp. MWH-Spelu-300-X4 TaxID=2689109 RepID=UPI001BFEEBC9|nr:FAD-dependent oxidoreductase [Polynucleobacter sp. MWH-Spelu-300-X4]QWD80050.1 FAD-dependent oxidoreductase [Polynucleobacter sp. MWH-Spelu-300-X4]